MQAASLWIVGVTSLLSGSILAQDRQSDDTPHTVRLIPVQETSRCTVHSLDPLEKVEISIGEA